MMKFHYDVSDKWIRQSADHVGTANHVFIAQEAHSLYCTWHVKACSKSYSAFLFATGMRIGGFASRGVPCDFPVCWIAIDS